MAVSLPLTQQEFNDSEQLKFKQSVARAAGVSSGDVSIDRIVDMNSNLTVRRRLLTIGIRVDTSIKAPDETTASALSTSLTADSLNSELVAVGLPAAVILEAPTFASDRQMTTTPVSIPPVIPGKMSESGLNLGAVIGGVVGGITACICILCACMYSLQGKSQRT